MAKLTLSICLSFLLLPCLTAKGQIASYSISQLVDLSKFRIPSGKTLEIVGGYSTKAVQDKAELDETCDNVQLDIAADPDPRFYVQFNNIDAPWIHNGGAGLRFHKSRAYYFDGTTLENITEFLNPQTLAPLHGNSVTLSNYDGSRKGVYLPITTGQGFLTSFLFGSDDGFIGKLIKMGVKPTLTTEKDGSVLNVTLTDSSGGGDVTEQRKANFSLDSSRNYALTKASITTTVTLKGQKHESLTEITVDDYTEVGDQYYPKKATFKETDDGQQVTDTEWHLTGAKFIDTFPNDPGIPPYSKVRDKRTGLEFSTGEKPSVLKSQMQNYIK